jgi:FkbM family methyltransferase
MNLHHKLAGLFGYELIKKRAINDTLDQHLGNVLQLQAINCVVDVGANKGSYGAMLRRVGYRGRIVSFEPLASAFASLQEASRGDDHWLALNLALGNDDSRMTINRMASSVFSSFLNPSKFGDARFSDRIEPVAQEDVRMTTLSHVWPEVVEGIRKPRVLLKLDTQGLDLEVFKGAAENLNQVLALQSELSLKPIYEDMPDFITALTEFRQHGFEVTGFYLVTRDKKSPKKLDPALPLKTSSACSRRSRICPGLRPDSCLISWLMCA